MDAKTFNAKEAWGKLSATAKKRIVMIVILAVVVLIFLMSFIVYVRPDEYGIMQVNIGINAGIQEKKYTTGFHFLMPFGINIMHKFPRNIQVLELNDYPESASSNARQVKAAHIQTSDGFYVDVDVSILYRIADPYKAITTVGPGKLYEDNGILPKAESKLKESLGELTTEEFFNSPLRVQKAEQAKQLLNNELNAKGIMVEYVLIRYFRYSEEIQRNIEEKKLKDQLVFTNQAKARASAEEAIVKKVKQEGEANVTVKLEEGNAYVVKLRADMDLYVRTKHAEADLLVKLAEAKKTDLVNQAYQKRGSDKLVGLEMAKVYRGLEVIMLPSSGKMGFNPLDLNRVLDFFGIKQ
ncbi:MAG: SPFH domain-containing protein [Spirochaetales bacterium]|nr:SPFH domain-containing protein [Spirochaetales bacterium]